MYTFSDGELFKEIYRCYRRESPWFWYRDVLLQASNRGLVKISGVSSPFWTQDFSKSVELLSEKLKEFFKEEMTKDSEREAKDEAEQLKRDSQAAKAKEVDVAVKPETSNVNVSKVVRYRLLGMDERILQGDVWGYERKILVDKNWNNALVKEYDEPVYRSMESFVDSSVGIKV